MHVAVSTYNISQYTSLTRCMVSSFTKDYVEGDNLCNPKEKYELNISTSIGVITVMLCNKIQYTE